MRRRPIEFWGIAAYCVARAALVFAFLAQDGDRFHADETERALFFLYALTLFFAPILLLAFQPAGRWMCTIVMGVEAAEMARRMAEGVEISGHAGVVPTIAFAVCLWLNVYLQRPTTAAHFDAGSQKAASSSPLPYSAGFEWFSLSDLCVALLAGWAARAAGAPLWLAMVAGVGGYIGYGMFLEERLRQRWDTVFARTETGFPEADGRGWRLSCAALARDNLATARKHFERLSPDAQAHAAGKLFSQALNWHELLSHTPLNGREALRRMVFDYDFVPTDDDRKRLTKHLQRSLGDDARALAAERAEMLDALIAAASNPMSFFRVRADRMLTRITGETFAFNAPESWAAWWRAKREHWTGDAGPMAIVARLVFRDCHAAALDVARKISARAEEPMLVELTEQMRFFNSMRQAAQGVGAPASFMDQPLQVLLVPEWSDAAGWLHADSPILANLGVNRRAAARRLGLRVKMIDYAASLWERYPAELNADLPWLLSLLAGKNFGVLRARAKFETWWPRKREAFVRHARALNAGLAAFGLGDGVTAEREFEAAIKERPSELSARYNLALCQAKRGDREGAERLLRELAAMEPKEPYWWMALGDLLRSSDRALAARAAYRRAQHLGASEGRVALHLGLTFAHEERDSEAMQLFERALGKNPTASKLEALAMQLENEGCWKLAGHYREEALRRELDGPPGNAGNERGDETAA